MNHLDEQIIFSPKLIKNGKTSLEDWLEVMFSNERDRLYPNNCFPSDEFLNEYISKIDEISETDFKKLLRMLLVNSCSYGVDEMNEESYLNRGFEEYPNEYYRRLVETDIAYEGITWILDFLPYYSKRVLNIIEAYDNIHFLTLPDAATNGLIDAQVLIRARYFQNAYKPNILLELQPREFECLIAKLYRELGYEVTLTKAQKDGGKDVIALINTVGRKETIYIECKRYNKKVGVNWVRALIGTISNDKISKGMLISPLGFTKGCINLTKDNSRIELLGAEELIILLNDNLGKGWFNLVPKYVKEFN